MAIYRIPEAYQKGFEFLIELNDEIRNRLIEEIKNAPDNLSLDDLADKLAETLSIEKNKINEIIQTILSLFNLKESSNLDTTTIVTEIVEALQKTKDEALKPPANFHKQLESLLSLVESPFYIKTKATRLATERDIILLNTRIITDVRPIFTEDISCEIKANIILHNLKIGYAESRQLKEIYFALDKDDLKKLKDNIERAEKKEKVLREELKKTNIITIDYKQ
ncbi:MAG: hypothetical protein ACRENZ_02720 [Thermodesulfobacteriota bacterium]